MSNKASETDEMVPVSSRMKRSLWLGMKREAVDSGIALQDLLEEACRDVLAKRVKKQQATNKERGQ